MAVEQDGAGSDLDHCPDNDELIFAKAGPEYAAHGLAVFPTGGDNGKRPLIKNYLKAQPSWAERLAEKRRFATANIGLVCGQPGGVTIVDVDDRSLVEQAIKRFGETPVKSVTPSGGIHLWYTSNGERRKIRLDGTKIDILGSGGIAIAPPSKKPANGGRYAFIDGGTENFDDLPTIAPGALPDAANGAPPQIDPRRVAPNSPEWRALSDGGGRNGAMFRQALRVVRGRGDMTSHDLAAELGAFNTFANPLPFAEVFGIASSALICERDGRNWCGQEARAVFTATEIADLIDKPDVLALLGFLRAHHGTREASFALSPRALRQSGRLSWSEMRIRKARDALIKYGPLAPVRIGKGGRSADTGEGYPNRYRLTGKPSGSN
jgi:hypothetical protein